ncbi:MAG TPA: glycoside hydrolase family 43 protein [Anditalea sp.]|nr:glycoside hydrolase family 43 protein [Anditalea sp.]
MNIKTLNLFHLALYCSVLSMGFSACSTGKSGIAENQTNSGYFSNPILPGFYPDPSICRVGEDYYLVTSTFSYFPGVPIFHSTDLVNWNQLGHVLDRPEQIDVEGLGISRGIFAPTIQYHDGIFYMVTTLVDNGGNFIVTATDPAGPWSDPYWLPEVNGIDPSIFFDEGGKSFVIYNSEAPDNAPLYDGHRTIRMIELNLETLTTVGENRILVNGGVNLKEKPVWIEGPHIFKREEYYYLTAAEGGTSVNHSQVVLRTKNLDEPFVPWESNPILTQRHLDPNRPNPVSATGHADLVQTQNGEWWAVFLATRPYDLNDSYNIGRETFLAPVKWTEDGWPVINPDHEKVQYQYPVPKLPPSSRPTDFEKSGNFTIVDNFDKNELAPYWFFIRVPKEQWYEINPANGTLSIALRPETASGTSNPSYIARRQQHIKGEANTSMDFVPQKGGEKAGMLIFQNENHHLFFGKMQDDAGSTHLIVHKAGPEDGEVLNKITMDNSHANETLEMKIEFVDKKYTFYYKIGAPDWREFYTFTEGEYLSTRVAGGFVGTTIGMYATSSGQPSTNKAVFHNFKYTGDDEQLGEF